MSIVWLLRIKGYQHVSRVYGPDLMLAVCKRSVEYRWRHYFYGGEPPVADQLVERLSACFPGLQIAGIFSPPFRPLSSEEDLDIIQQINKSQADIVWVGISTPKQERWMAEHREQITAPVLIGVGAAFDFLSGNKAQAPAWVQRVGLEWLFRLASEPKRLWKRYILYPYFGLLVLAQELGFKRYTVE
jgi:N-acetylglucosaminyldiphosphoundecaprenol N-acetyl-beta-D-mannosaminyltransferase